MKAMAHMGHISRLHARDLLVKCLCMIVTPECQQTKSSLRIQYYSIITYYLLPGPTSVDPNRGPMFHNISENTLGTTKPKGNCYMPLV